MKAWWLLATCLIFLKIHVGGIVRKLRVRNQRRMGASAVIHRPKEWSGLSAQSTRHTAPYDPIVDMALQADVVLIVASVVPHKAASPHLLSIFLMAEPKARMKRRAVMVQTMYYASGERFHIINSD